MTGSLTLLRWTQPTSCATRPEVRAVERRYDRRRGELRQDQEFDDSGCLRCSDAPELTATILRAFTADASAVVQEELQRYLWNSAMFGYAVPLDRARSFIINDRAGDFVYHQRTQLMFTGVSAHPILMSYLAALHKTDFTAPMSGWGPDTIYDWNATSKLADEFIEQGLGFYRSKVGGGAITVAPGFPWTAQEKRIFATYPRRSL
jgi:hypothetical protein